MWHARAQIERSWPPDARDESDVGMELDPANPVVGGGQEAKGSKFSLGFGHLLLQLFHL